MRFDKPMGVNRLHPRLDRFTNRILPRDEHGPRRGDPQVKNHIEDICNKAERDPWDGSISIPDGNLLLHMVMRYLAPRYTPDEMLDIAAAQKNIPRALLAWELGQFGEISFDRINVDFIMNLFEVEETPRQDLDTLAEEFEKIKSNNSDAAMIAALSLNEMYYTAALRKVCKPLNKPEQEK